MSEQYRFHLLGQLEPYKLEELLFSHRKNNWNCNSGTEQVTGIREIHE